jgi:geranylgeranyl diphosphate synthase type I
MVGEETAAHEDELHRVGVEPGETVGHLVDEPAVVTGVTGQGAQPLEGEHASARPDAAEEVAHPGHHGGAPGQHVGVAPEPQGAVGQALLGVGGAGVDPSGRVGGRDHGEVGGGRPPGEDPGRTRAEHEVVRDLPGVGHDPLFDHHRVLGGVDEVRRGGDRGVERVDPAGAEELGSRAVGHRRIVPTAVVGPDPAAPHAPTALTRPYHPVVAGPSPPPPVPAGLRAVGDRVDARILALLDDETDRWSAVDPVLAEPLGALRALVAAGGKRLRPAFCHWAFVGAGGDPDDPRIVDAGAALELLHTFALVHDDVMDGSDRRRGAPSVHRAFTDRHVARGWQGDARRSGEGAAILIGDFAFVYADQVIGELTGSARAVFDEMRLELCVGQFLDLVGTAGGSRDPDAAVRIERFKSGKYTVERPLHLGAALAGAPPETLAAWTAVGLPLGEAFQLRDDLLGTFGEAEVTGKPVGEDLREGKCTPLLTEAVARAGPAEQARLARVGTADLGAAEIADLQAVLVATGAVAAVEARITARVDEALTALAAVPVAEPARAALVDLARYAAWRDR